MTDHNYHPTYLRPQHIKTIERIERIGLSVNGNPAYMVAFTDGTEARTSSDAAVSYEIGNPGLREGCKVAVMFTRAGRIAYMVSDRAAS